MTENAVNKCHNPECGKPIPKDKKYCGTECLKRHLEIKKQAKKRNQTEKQTHKSNQSQEKAEITPFWIKGEGSRCRNHNIAMVKQMISEGISYQDIRRKACRFFTFRKFDEYYEIASDEIRGDAKA
jgi:predicted nucleic acid-binding Zn ribbon protein